MVTEQKKGKREKGVKDDNQDMKEYDVSQLGNKSLKWIEIKLKLCKNDLQGCGDKLIYFGVDHLRDHWLKRGGFMGFLS